MRMRRALYILPAMSLCVAACIGAEVPEPASRSIVADAIVEVRNETLQPVTVYVETGRVTGLLGRVPRESSRSFSIPSAVAKSDPDLRLHAEGGRGRNTSHSSLFRLSSGAKIVWILGEHRGRIYSSP